MEMSEERHTENTLEAQRGIKTSRRETHDDTAGVLQKIYRPHFKRYHFRLI
jgi:hypothetical protein